MFYGGGLGLFASRRIEILFHYESHSAKNPTTLTSPAISGAGLDLATNIMWGGLNLHFLNSGKVFGYVGGSVGYPTYVHVVQTMATKTDFELSKGYTSQARLGFGLSATTHIRLYVEGGYQWIFFNNIQTTTGTVLRTTFGSNATMDLGGPRVLAGLSLGF